MSSKRRATVYVTVTKRATAIALAMALAVGLVPLTPAGAAAAQSPPAPMRAVVAVHVSEYTRALHSTPGVAAPGSDAMGWYHDAYTYSMVYTMLEESLRADGTPFVEVTDADIAGGALLSGGVPLYPIVFSLMSEAASDAELAALSAYAAAGGYVYVGGSAFTRRPDGTFRTAPGGGVQSGLAAEMGLESAASVASPRSGTTWSWDNTNVIRRVSNDPMVGELTSGQDLSWPLPRRFDSNTALMLTVDEGWHPVWVTRPTAVGPATALATMPRLAATAGGAPLLASKTFGSGRFIYQAEMAPLAGWGGYAPDTYEYLFIRRAIEAAFDASGVPLARLSAWRYPYRAALQMRWDCDFYPGAVDKLSQIEVAHGFKSQYYINTSQVDDAGGWVQALAQRGAIIGSHSNVHEGPDVAPDAATAASNISSSLDSLQSWTGKRTGNWVAPAYQCIKDSSFQVLEQVGVKTAGEQNFGPFPHFTLSMTTPGKHYDVLQIPTAKWLPSSATDADARSRMEQMPIADMPDIVDFYYGLGGVINVYGHPFGWNLDRLPSFLDRAQSKGDVWFTDAPGIRDWWLLRDKVSVSSTASRAGDRVQSITTLTGATDPDTTIDVVPPGVDAVSIPDVQVTLDGVPSTAFKIAGSAFKIRVGRAATVVVSWTAGAVDTTPPDPPTAVVATPSPMGGAISLAWADPSNPDFSHVHVYRSTVSGAVGTLVADSVVGQQYTDKGLTNGTNYYYTLRAADRVGNESVSSAQVSATPVAPPPGVQNVALAFDHADDLVSVPYSPVMNAPGALTVEAWVYADAILGEPMLASRWNDAQLSWTLYYQSDGRVLFYVRTPGDTGYVQAKTDMNTLTLGAWHHVAGVVDPAAQQLRVYVDGTLATSAAYPYPGANSSTAGLSINAAKIGGVWSALGDVRIDEVRLSGSARYTGSFTPSDSFASDGATIGLWHFDEGAGATALDSGPYGLSGTLLGDPGWFVRGTNPPPPPPPPPAATYTITPSAGAGGAITPTGPQTVASGGSVSFAITATTGYHVADVLVDGSSAGAVTSYTFNNVTASHTIAATFAPHNPATRFEQTDGHIAFQGTWSPVSRTTFSGGTLASTNTNGGVATIRFSGTSIDYITATDSTYGIAQVTLDGGTPVDVDLYSATRYVSQVRVWGASGLADGEHTLTIRRTGRRNAASTGYSVGLDALDVVGTLVYPTLRFEQTDSRILFTGAWSTSSRTTYSGGSLRQTATSGSYVTIPFRGTAIGYVTAKDSTHGIAQVTLDGGAPVDVDLYSATRYVPQVKVWSASGLADANHTLTIRYTGRRNAASSGYTVGLDAVDITGSLR